MMTAHDVAAWPTAPPPLVQRYPDARPATLTVFTPASFAAAKTVAWADRKAARDLCDLWGLVPEGSGRPRIDERVADAGTCITSETPLVSRTIT
jgi:hypothetical protein